MYTLKHIINNGEHTWTGDMGLICPNCLEATIYEGSVSIHRKPVHVQVLCPKCGHKFSTHAFNIIDPNIVNTIAILNRKGYKTKACCEGHVSFYYGEKVSNDAYVYLDNVEDVNIIEDHPLPQPWYIDKEDLAKDIFVIRCNEENKVHLLESWAKSLNNKDKAEFEYFY